MPPAMAAPRKSARKRAVPKGKKPAAPILPPPAPRPVPLGRFSTAAAQSAEARRRALIAWRGIDVGPLEIARQDKARPASDLMPAVMKKLGLEQKHTESQIVKVWNNLIDPAVAAHAQPTGLRRGTLFVKVDNNVWLSEIVRYRRFEILKRLQHAFGTDLIAKISFSIG